LHHKDAVGNFGYTILSLDTQLMVTVKSLAVTRLIFHTLEPKYCKT